MATTLPREAEAPEDTDAGQGRSAFSPSPLGWAARALVLLAVAWLVLVFPLSQEGFEVQRYTTAVIYGIIGLSLNVLLGYVGQISLGHQAFVGIGAYTTVILVAERAACSSRPSASSSLEGWSPPLEHADPLPTA